MVRVPSTMLPLGTPLPEIDLPDAAGNRWSSRDAADARALVVMFICNHCPFVKHVRHELARLAKDYQPRGVAFVGINSNDAEKYPDDSPAKMREEAAAVGYTFPYLVDATQEVARSFRAACTPDFYVFDRARRLVYRGQLDASRPGNDVPVTGRDLRAALDAVLANAAVSDAQTPSIGCNIKWKPGSAPEWFG
jgi:thiol-disulfide isomerase/thioredoxin